MTSFRLDDDISAIQTCIHLYLSTYTSQDVPLGKENVGIPLLVFLFPTSSSRVSHRRPHHCAAPPFVCMETASSELLGVSSLPPSVLALIFRLLPEADRCRSGGVSRAWRAIAHAPALWGPNLVLAPVLEAPRTVCDTTKGADSVCIYGVVKRRSKSRASATSVLRSLAKLTGGTLKSIDARQNWRCESFSSPFACTLESEQPDVVWAEELVDICAANTGLDEVVTDQPASCEGA